MDARLDRAGRMPHELEAAFAAESSPVSGLDMPGLTVRHVVR
jgi:hypothetical protein